MAQRVTVGKLADFPAGGAVVVTVGTTEVAIFNVDGTLYALDDRCPHRGASLAGGHVADGCVVCPWHHWRFRLADGAWADSPKVKTGWYPVHVVGDEVQLEWPQAGG